MSSVALVIPNYVPAVRYGGPILSTHALARSLLQSGWGVTVLTSDGDGPNRMQVPAIAAVDGVEVHYLRRLAREALVPQVALALWRIRPRPDVVHIGPPFASCTVFAHVAAVALRLPIVLSPRGSFDPWALTQKRQKKRIALRAMRPMLRSVTVVHATSEAERDAVTEILPGTPTRVVPNGVDLPQRQEKSSRNSLPTVLYLGRLHPVKAIDRLLDACALLSARGIRFRIVIAGGGNDAYRAELVRRQNEAGLADRVDWFGVAQGEQKWRLLAQARVLVLPSHSESFGNVVLEALAAGCPVVASSTTPWRELHMRACGQWVANDPPSLAAAIEPYLLDAQAAEEDGARGRELVEEKYTWGRVAQSMAELYRFAMLRRASEGHNDR